jgi:hypothetical protein
MLINKKSIKDYVKTNGKQISKEALESLDKKVANILDKSINAVGRFKRIGAIEINY